MSKQQSYNSLIHSLTCSKKKKNYKTTKPLQLINPHSYNILTTY